MPGRLACQPSRGSTQARLLPLLAKGRDTPAGARTGKQPSQAACALANPARARQNQRCNPRLARRRRMGTAPANLESAPCGSRIERNGEATMLRPLERLMSKVQRWTSARLTEVHTVRGFRVL